MSRSTSLLLSGCLLITSAVATACSDDAAESTTTSDAPTTNPSASTTSPGSATAGGQAAQADPGAASTEILALGGTSATPGCAAAVGHDGDVVWTDEVGLASMSSNDTITSSTIFDIGSVSKQFTAAAVLQLVLEGKVALADPLADYFPDLPDWAGEVTVSHLIHHQSGIPDYLNLLEDAGYALSDATTQSQAVEAVSKVRSLDFDPGSSFYYSNSNYILMADIVAMVSGKEFADFVEETIFAPLDLDMTVAPGLAAPNKATSYEHQDDQWIDARSGWLQVGDGAIQTTASELVRWADNYRTGEFGGEEFLELQLEGAVPVGSGMPVKGDYGAGIVEQPNGRLVHTGSWERFFSTFVISRDRHHAVAVTCNHLPGGMEAPGLIKTMGDTILDQWAGAGQ